MADRRDDTQLRTEKRRAQLGDQLLTGIALAAPFAGEVAIEARCVAGPMTEFMQLGAGDVFGAAVLGTLSISALRLRKIRSSPMGV